MASDNLFAAGGRPEQPAAVNIKAGKMTMTGMRVTADPRRGKLTVNKVAASPPVSWNSKL
jgi:hypothetical protein